MPVTNSPPFTVADLLCWADTQALAANALNPHWDSQAFGFILTTDSSIPLQNAKLPNGFRFPSSVMTDYQRGLFYEVISNYEGPDPTTSSAFDRVQGYILAHYGEELTTGTARRFLGDLVSAHRLSRDAAARLTLEDAMSHLDGNDGKEGSKVHTPATAINQLPEGTQNASNMEPTVPSTAPEVAKGLPKLKPVHKAALKIVSSMKGTGLNAKALVARLKKEGHTLKESTFRRHHVPVLKAHGVLNDSSCGGYYLPSKSTTCM